MILPQRLRAGEGIAVASPTTPEATAGDEVDLEVKSMGFEMK